MAEPQVGMNGWFVNILLRSLQKVAGPLYSKVLSGTPFQEFITKLPPDDPTVNATKAVDFGLLTARAYSLLGRDLYIAFGRNASREIAKPFAAIAAPIAAAQLVDLTGVARLQAAARLDAKMMAQQGMSMLVTDLPVGVLIEEVACPECIYLHTSEPICYFIAEGFKQGLADFCGFPVSVTETHCFATTQSGNCVFEVRPRS